MVGFYKPEMGRCPSVLMASQQRFYFGVTGTEYDSFNVGAFWGIYSAKTILSIALSSYVIFLVTSLADTPFVYLARYLKDKNIFFRAGQD